MLFNSSSKKQKSAVERTGKAKQKEKGRTVVHPFERKTRLERYLLYYYQLIIYKSERVIRCNIGVK